MFDSKMLGNRIRELRGKTPQEVCARELGVSRGAMSYYENGTRNPDADVISRMCRYFNVSADYLLGLSDVKSTEQDMKIACEVTGLSEDAVTKLRSKTAEKETLKEVYGLMISNELFHSLAAVLNQFDGLDKTLKGFSESMSSKELLSLNVKDINENIELMKRIMFCFQQLSTFYALGDMARAWINDVLDRLTDSKWNTFKEAALLVQIIVAKEGNEGTEFLRNELAEFSKQIEGKSHGKHNQTEE